MNKKYTASQLIKKYANKYIKTYAYHFDKWNNKINKYETVYEVLGTSKTIKENYNLPQDCLVKGSGTY